MRVIFRNIIYWLLLGTISCHSSDDLVVSSSRLAAPQQHPDTTQSQIIYPILAHVLSHSGSFHPDSEAQSVRSDALESWTAFAYRLQQAQSAWHDANRYYQWYGENLAQSYALTFTEQTEIYTRVGWNFNNTQRHTEKRINSGSCTMTVYQRSDTLLAEMFYEDIELEAETIIGNQSVAWKIESDGHLKLINDYFWVAKRAR